MSELGCTGLIVQSYYHFIKCNHSTEAALYTLLGVGIKQLGGDLKNTYLKYFFLTP